MVELSFLSPSDAATVEAVLAAGRRGLGEKLRSAVLVGPALPPPRHVGAVGVDVLLVVSDLPVAALGNLAGQLRAITSPRVGARVLTERELLRATDVFALELAEHGERHLLLEGADPLRDLHLTSADLRRSLEQSLRALSWRLRDGALRSSSEPSVERRRMRELLAGVLDELAIVAHHTLALLSAERPTQEDRLLEELARRSRVDVGPLLGWLAPFRHGVEPGDAMAALAELLELVEAATTLVDGIGAGE